MNNQPHGLPDDSAWNPDGGPPDSTWDLVDSGQNPDGIPGVACAPARTRAPASRPDKALQPSNPQPDLNPTVPVSGEFSKAIRDIQAVASEAIEEQTRTAVIELRKRGVTDAEMLLEFGRPDQILAAIRRWDSETGVSKNLLVWRIRNAKFESDEVAEARERPSKSEQLRDLFDAFCARFPEGSIIETHTALDARRWPDDSAGCEGAMRLRHASYPVAELECDVCGFEVGWTPKTIRQHGILKSTG